MFLSHKNWYFVFKLHTHTHTQADDDDDDDGVHAVYKGSFRRVVSVRRAVLS